MSLQTIEYVTQGFAVVLFAGVLATVAFLGLRGSINLLRDYPVATSASAILCRVWLHVISCGYTKRKGK